MSSYQALKPERRASERTSYKLQTPKPITTCPTSNFTYQINSTNNFSQKENLQFKPLTQSLGQQSCRALRPTSALEQVKVYPQTARNHYSIEQNVENEVKKKGETLYKEHLFNTFQAMKFVRTLYQPSAEELRSKTVNLVKRPGYENKRTIVFDLDETLVHCVEKPENGDFVIDIPLGVGKNIRAGVKIRPYAREILASACQDFEVIVFTASHKSYADLVIDRLDPKGELVHHRLYREHCLVKGGVFIKDLRIFGNRKVEDMIIVDNSAYCFAYQIENGIPIISWFDDNNDRELYKLIEYIKILAVVPDICAVNRHTFRLSTFYNDYLRDFLKFQDRDI